MKKVTISPIEEKGAAIYEESLEEIVLAACLLEPASQGEALGRLRPEMFYKDRHRLVFEAIAGLYAEGTPIDILTVSEHLRRQGRLEEAGGPAFIAGLYGKIASTAHLGTHLALLYEYHVRRELTRQIMPVMGEVADVMSDVFDLIIRMRKVLDALYDDSPLETHLHTLPEVIELTIGTVARRQASSADGLTGVPTGFADLDQMTGGWQPGNLIYVAGRPGDGKTAIALHMARAAARAGVPVLLCTLEMNAAEIGERMALAQTDIDPLRMRQGRLTEAETEALNRCRAEADALPLSVDDTPYMGIDQLAVLVKSLHGKGRCGLLIVDYLQLLGTTAPGRTREQEVAECSRKLKALARSTGCPVIVASQLNRQAEEQATAPDLRHLRESGAIEQDADIVLLIHRPYRHHITIDPETGSSTLGMGILNVAKHRNGSVGTVRYSHDESMTHITRWSPRTPSDDDTRRALQSRYGMRRAYPQKPVSTPKPESHDTKLPF